MGKKDRISFILGLSYVILEPAHWANLRGHVDTLGESYLMESKGLDRLCGYFFKITAGVSLSLSEPKLLLSNPTYSYGEKEQISSILGLS